MEGGQKKVIPLDSELDVKSSDQLVPVDSPKFQHNRQRFQGSTLPTSLRFEHNGVAAGWDVYEFEVNYLTVDTSPAKFTVMRQQINNNPTYVFRLRIGTTTYAMVYWNGEDTVKAGDLEIAHGEGEDFATVTLKGDNDGHELELAINMVDGTFSYDDAEWYLVESSYLDATALNGQTDISLLDLTNWVEFNAAVLPPQDAVYSGKKIASYYSCVEQDDGTHLHTWSDPLADNAWTVTYCPETDTVLVNGEEAAHSFSEENGQLAITYNTEYSAVIDVKVIGEVFYFQIYGISVNQVQKYVASGATGAEDFEVWRAETSGATYLYPASLDSERKAYVRGFIPYWCGIAISMSETSSASALDVTQVALSDGGDASQYPSIYEASVWLLSSDSVSFYSDTIKGATVSLWEGDHQRTGYIEVGESSFDSFADIYGTLTYCLCVFNRIAVDEDNASSYTYGSYPFTAGDADSSVLVIEERVPWHDVTDDGTGKATLLAKDGAAHEFCSGFYAPMEAKYSEEAGGGYVLVSEGSWPAGVAESYYGEIVPLATYNSLVAAALAADSECGLAAISLAETTHARKWAVSSSLVGTYQDDLYSDSLVLDTDDEYNGCMRLEWPYAFYGIELETEGWSGGAYDSSVGTGSDMGAVALDLLLSIHSPEYEDAATRLVYWLGDSIDGFEGGYGYILPYFRTVESGDDTRTFLKDGEDEDEDEDEDSTSYVYSCSVIKGILSGLSIDYSSVIEGEATYTGYGTGVLGSAWTPGLDDTKWSQAKSGAVSVAKDKIAELEAQGYLVSSSVSYKRAGQSNVTDSKGNLVYRYRYKYTITYYTSVTKSAAIKTCDGTTMLSAASGDSDIGAWDFTEAAQTFLGIEPLAAYFYAKNFSTRDDANLQAAVSSKTCLYVSFCFKGQFQSELMLGPPSTRPYVITQDNLSDIVSFERSDTLVLENKTGLYIDRAIDGDGDEDSLATYIGLEDMDLCHKEASISNGEFSLDCYVTPHYEFDEEAQTGSYGTMHVFWCLGSSDGYVPGQIYNNSLAMVASGVGLQGSAVGYTYTTSGITFSVNADVVEFFKATDIDVSWPLSTGTHDFYDDVLPSAVKALLSDGVTFNSPTNTRDGAASSMESLNLEFNGKDIQLMVSFSQEDDNGTTAVAQTDGTEPMEYEGYEFAFSINKASWDESEQEVSLRVTVPLTYEIAARPPYQYNYDTLEYDEESGLYTVNGDTDEPLDAVPVGSLAVGFDPTEMQYKFLTKTDDPYTYYFLKNTGEFKYGLEKFESMQVGEARCAAIEGFEYLEFSFILEGAYRTYKCTVRSFDEESITVSYDGTDYTFPYSELMTDEEPDEMNFMYTDTRDDKAIPDTVTFARQNFEKEFQFLRQTWETTNAIENYWWIDEETILELNKTSLTVKKKKIFDDYAEEATVDDWGGDFWEDAASFPRYEYIDNTVARYGVTNAYGGEERPRFWTIKEVSSTKLKITFYALVETDYGTYTDYALEDVSTTVTLNQVEIGTVLNNPSYDRMNTYSQLSVESIIYDSQFSATVIGQHILFGIHNDNNFNQWALDISTTGELLQVVQGYGFVGVNGCLTGGEIPSAWFDPSIGFTGTVQPIDVIEQEEAIDVTTPEEFTALDCGDIVVGDESQQWYVSKKISSIVSHLLWDEEAEMWGTEVLYLNNNLEQVYGSASFGANVLSERGLNYHNFFTELVEHIDCSGLSDIMDAVGKIGTCYFVYYSPRLTTMLYLQQTMGQYAYVHYNTTSPNKQVDQGRVNLNREASEKWYGKEGIVGTGYNASGTRVEDMGENWVEPATPDNEDDFSFNLHTLRQQLYIDNCWAGVGFALMYILIQAGMSLSDSLSGIVDSKASGMKWGDAAKTSVKQFGQMVSQNALSMTSMDMGVLGNLPTQNSAVTGVLTLDMFYSTSEGQAIQAGPGFVQHNFQAQCVAQSVTSNQMELKQVGAFISLSELGTLAYKVIELALRYVADAAIGGAAILASGGDSAGVMGTAAAATAVVALVTKYTIQLLLDICDVVDKLFRAIASNVPPAQALNMRSNHAFDMEGKHKYGQKSEIFMWPCWGVSKPIEYENESVEAVCQNIPWRLSVPTGAGGEIGGGDPETSGSVLGLDADSVTYNVGSDITLNFSGEVPYMAASCKGKTETTQCPENMAAIIGCESFLPPVPFRNEGVGVREPQFTEQVIQDYMIDEEWELSMTCARGMIAWVSCRDTKLINGAPSNVVIYDDFCGVASPYTAIEIKRGYEQKYMRAWAVTPMAVGVNQSGLNAAYEEKAYHAFDGYGGRIVKWCGSSGMNKEGVVKQYAFIANDRFKRSNNVGFNTLYGNFGGEPILALRTIGEDEVYNNVERDTRERMGFVGIPGEDKDAVRYAMPVFAETVSVLPAVMKTISSFNLAVIDGITGLVSNNVDAQSRYKAPVSIDFAIGHKKYRFTDEYINELEVDPKYGVTTVKELVPTLGLAYLGATPYEAYLYSSATRQYYTYAGGTSLNAIDTIERFRDVIYGRYDFVNQEVVLPCVATFDRLDRHVHDDEDERDNTMVPRLKDGKFVGEVWPPIETIYNMRSGFKTISLPSGICFQGPNRCVINRFVYSDYMKNQIIENRGQWTRVPREKYHPFRVYEDEYVKVDENPLVQIVGWTHNPFLLVTSPLGVNSETDCLFEWEITFAWPVEMDGLYSAKQYLVVNVMAETFTPGGKVVPERPAHVFLTRDLFTRTGNYGYYSYRYQSKCGAGNRERLHIWSDQYICVSSLQLEYKPITQKRTEILTQAVDVQLLEEP